MSKIFLLAAALAVAFADDSYVVLTPSSFRGGLPLSVSVNILKATAPVSVTASLVNEGAKTTVATVTGSFSKGTPGTLKLQIPDDVHAGSYKLHVAGSGGATFKNETSISFESKSISLFIQTDKAMYKPGQTVNFRAFAVFPNLTVFTGPMDIDIYDPATNKIKQWMGLSDVSGVVTKFMLMDSQPVLGDWKIKVSAHGRSEEKTFTVAHYVLPKFEVTVELPSYILTSDDSITGKIKATYTYGKPVKGTADIRLKMDHWYRPYNYHGDEPQVTQKLSIDGETSFTIQLSQLKQANHYLNGHKFVVEANVTESLNSITLNGSNKVQIYDHAVKLEYLPSNPNTFKPGLPYTAYLKVVQQDDTPITVKRESLTVKVQSTWQEQTATSTPYPWYTPPQHSYYMADQTFTVPDAGIVPIQVDIPDNSTHINVEAHYGKIVARLSLSKSYSPSDNYMQLFLKSSSLRPGQTATFEIKSTETVPSAVYQVMSRGSVVAAGSFNGNHFDIPIDARMAPNARIIVYYVRTDGEVVTDSISFDVDGAFQNEVTIDFDKSKAQPGENVNVIVKADPKSVVNLLAVDQSVLLLKSGNDVTASEVIDELKSYDTIRQPRSPFCCDFMPMAVNRRKRFAIWWPYPVYYGGSDAQAIFDNSGVRVMTDATVYHHVEQHLYYPMMPGMVNGGPMMAMAGGAMPNPVAPMSTSSASGMKAVDTVRSVFPETWLWTNSSTGFGISRLGSYIQLLTSDPTPTLVTGSIQGIQLCRKLYLGEITDPKQVPWKTILMRNRTSSPDMVVNRTVYPVSDPNMTFDKMTDMVPAPSGAAMSHSLVSEYVNAVRSVFPETWLWNIHPEFAGFGVGGGGGGGGDLAGLMPPPSGAGTSMSHGTQQQAPVTKIRSVFPETWLWSNSSVGADGTVTINTTIPDTITSWIASAFAVNSISGLGVASSSAKWNIRANILSLQERFNVNYIGSKGQYNIPKYQVEAFKPFFVSLNIPYSVVRGEQLALQANVFNYMSQDLDVVVTLEQSNDFKNVIVDSSGTVQYVSQQKVQNIHVAAGAAKSVFFPIVPAALGKIPVTVKAQSILAADAVRRQLLIEPEGVAKEYSNPILIDLKNVSTFSKDVALSLPSGVVAGSQRVVISAIGDLMGPTVNNLDKLLRMPTGCGEQTMLGFAPDVFVTNYLTATNQLTGDIEEKAINFLEKGYQRELTFQHKDGSFSAFGDRDKSGSMWLSAFVTKSFHQAKKQIFIDDDTIKRAIDWMISRQNADGSFPEPGRVIHKDMQGGSASGLGLTAFVLISLLENNDLGGSIQQRINKAVTMATGYVENQLATTSDDYALAISSFALRLAKSSSADTAFAKLNNDAIVKDGMRHWHKAQTSSSSHHYWRPSHSQANPIDIEMTSYALLVQAAKQDFGNGIPIMKWITSQRNSNGGFASTQDTVIGLQALSEFAALAYSDNFDIQATITAGTFTHKFSINKQNALLLQTVVLPSIPSQVSVTATGHGMALVDINLSFHVEQEIEEKSFDVTVTMVQESVDFLSIKTCATWLKTGASGMAVQEFGIPSGFEADLESIAGVTEIKKVETEDRKVILYFDEISTKPLCLTMDVIRTGMVAKSQPATMRVYDYYQPSNQVTAFYESHVLKNSDICDVCADCGCKGARRR